MSFTIPNLGDAGWPDQAEPDAQDFRVITDASGLTGVLSGCAVAAQGTPDMTVAVSSGTILSNGTQQTVTSGNVTIAAADATNPRFDLIVADSSGAKQRRAGTAAANPVFPSPTAGDIVLSAVYVPANDTAINSNQIVDKRITVINLKALANTWTETQTFSHATPIQTDLIAERTAAQGVTIDGVVMKDGGIRLDGDPGGIGGYTTFTEVFGVGNGANANVIAPAKGTGDGPATLTVVQWLKVYIGGAAHWIPVCF